MMNQKSEEPFPEETNTNNKPPVTTRARVPLAPNKRDRCSYIHFTTDTMQWLSDFAFYNTREIN